MRKQNNVTSSGCTQWQFGFCVFENYWQFILWSQICCSGATESIGHQLTYNYPWGLYPYCQHVLSVACLKLFRCPQLFHLKTQVMSISISLPIYPTWHPPIYFPFPYFFSQWSIIPTDNHPNHKNVFLLKWSQYTTYLVTIGTIGFLYIV